MSEFMNYIESPTRSGILVRCYEYNRPGSYPRRERIQPLRMAWHFKKQQSVLFEELNGISDWTLPQPPKLSHGRRERLNAPRRPVTTMTLSNLVNVLRWKVHMVSEVISDVET